MNSKYGKYINTFDMFNKKNTERPIIAIVLNIFLSQKNPRKINSSRTGAIKEEDKRAMVNGKSE